MLAKSPLVNCVFFVTSFRWWLRRLRPMERSLNSVRERWLGLGGRRTPNAMSHRVPLHKVRSSQSIFFFSEEIDHACMHHKNGLHDGIRNNNDDIGCQGN